MENFYGDMVSRLSNTVGIVKIKVCNALTTDIASNIGLLCSLTFTYRLIIMIFCINNWIIF